MNPFLYFDPIDSFEDNKELYRTLCKQYHPDKPTGDVEIMKRINSEWEKITELNEEPKYILEPLGGVANDLRNLFDALADAILNNAPIQKEEPEEKFIIFKGVKYYRNDERILEKIALRHGGLTLMEFMNSAGWKKFTEED